MKQKKIPLSLQIFLALGLGIAVGMAFTGNPTFAVSYIKPFGTIFLNLLKFVVVHISVRPCTMLVDHQHIIIKRPSLAQQSHQPQRLSWL